MKVIEYICELKHRNMNPQRIPLMCAECKEEIFADVNMVMIKDELWEEAIQMDYPWEDALCADCIQIRLGRPITPDDFKTKTALCNHYWWAEQQKK